jgi:branched-chain amino acid aminotransferase
MSTLVMIDGELVQEDHARVSVFDRGFLYGDSVFETIRTYDGIPFALDEHLARLEKSAGQVFIQLPMSREQLQGEVLEAVRAAGNPETYIRVMITRGTAPLGLDPLSAEHPLCVVIVAPLPEVPRELYEQGIAVVTYRTQRTAEATPAATAKVGNYLVSVLALREARKAGALEALIVDSGGFIVEGASSNIFIARGGRLVTPPEDAGILPGITRRLLLDTAHAEGIPVDLEPLPLGELRTADEVFISSTTRELLPVVRVDGALVGSGSPGALTLRLLTAFRRKFHNPG